MKLRLPPTEVLYRRAMERSAEIKKRVLPKSAAELIAESGQPNMLEGRSLMLRNPTPATSTK